MIELSEDTRYFGIVRNAKPEGLGLIVGKDFIESGTYHCGMLNGKSRRLVFKDYYYKGNTHLGILSGKGVKFCAKEKKKISGIFEYNIIAKVEQEEGLDINSLSTFFL